VGSGVQISGAEPVRLGGYASAYQTLRQKVRRASFAKALAIQDTTGRDHGDHYPPTPSARRRCSTMRLARAAGAGAEIDRAHFLSAARTATPRPSSMGRSTEMYGLDENEARRRRNIRTSSSINPSKRQRPR